MRKIIHIDMDAFFASIEQRDFPQLRGKPVAVGRAESRGVVAAASYEARRYGVHSAMPSVTALRKCPDLIFTPPRFEVYHQVSETIMAIFHQYTDLVEPLSLDEAFLDVIVNKFNFPSASLIAAQIKKRIKQQTGLTASAGISVNKFLAKVASDQCKPDGLFLIGPDDVIPFIDKLQIDKFFGVGEKTTKRMHQLGIYNGHDLRQWSHQNLMSQFGKMGDYFYQIARGIDERPVEPSRERKSVGIEYTFETDISQKEAVEHQLSILVDDLWRRILEFGKFGRTLTLKVKYYNFEQITRSKTLLLPLTAKATVNSLAFELLDSVDIEKSIRLLGLSLSNFDSEKQQDAIQLSFDFGE
jgi:DNA polymerase-4